MKNGPPLPKAGAILAGYAGQDGDDGEGNRKVGEQRKGWAESSHLFVELHLAHLGGLARLRLRDLHALLERRLLHLERRLRRRDVLLPQLLVHDRLGLHLSRKIGF